MTVHWHEISRSALFLPNPIFDVRGPGAMPRLRLPRLRRLRGRRHRDGLTGGSMRTSAPAALHEWQPKQILQWQAYMPRTRNEPHRSTPTITPKPGCILRSTPSIRTLEE